MRILLVAAVLVAVTAGSVVADRADAAQRRASTYQRHAQQRHHRSGASRHRLRRFRLVHRTRKTLTIAWARIPAGQKGHRRGRRVTIRLNGRRAAVVHGRRHRLTLHGLRCASRYHVEAVARGARWHHARRAAITLRTRSCRSAPSPAAPAPGSGTHHAPGAGGGPRIFAYYYLWWSADHWRQALGPNYPLTAQPLPLPARLDAGGCNPTAAYAGATVTDVPSRIYSQDDPGQIESDVREAASAGLAGFAVNWLGTGQAGQSASSNPYSRRLQALVQAVHRVNAQGIPFKLWLSLKASASVVSEQAISNDLGYFVGAYGHDPAFDRDGSGRITVIWNGSRKYPVSTLSAISDAYRSRLRLLGDETSWPADRARYLDGDAYYWSSQDPYNNPQSFAQLGKLAGDVRASGRNPDGSAKAWIAPLAPGFDKQLAGGGACTPRRGGETLRRLFAGNAATRPDAWALISWNEITEGTYVDPMTRYGRQDLDVLRSLTGG
ncbi:MAG: hypothetical protein QOF26_1830 [Baekduia sp.]|jgi:hypothetical protein|nr:hypothetical protein [Baekduia sp.]MEA2280386.1 hypothetical protein [Solirubrobacteraceae bacterium]